MNSFSSMGYIFRGVVFVVILASMCLWNFRNSVINYTWLYYQSQDYSCGVIDGQNELSQMKQYLILKEKKETLLKLPEIASNSKFEYQIHQLKEGYGGLFIIEEKYKNMPTLGGSSFRVELYEYVENDIHFKLCHIRDHFTGNYTICCAAETQTWNISVFLMYTNYYAYHGKRSELPLLRLLKMFRSKHLKSASYEESASKYGYCDLPPSMDGRGHWMYRNKNWLWTSDDGCMLQSLTPTQLSSCLLNLNSLTFIGSSHMRYNWDYMIKFSPKGLNNSLPLKHGTVYQGKCYFERCTFASELYKIIFDIFNERGRKQLTLDDVIAFQTGTWDVHETKDVSKLIFEEMPQVLKTVKKLKNMPQWAKARLVLFTPVGFPHGSTEPWRRKRNNYVLAALNALLVRHLRGTGCDIMDVFQVVYPRVDDSVDGIHYVKREKYTITGLNFLHLFLSNVCQAYI